MSILISAISATSALSSVSDERPAYLVLAVLLAVCSARMMGWVMGVGERKSEKREA